MERHKGYYSVIQYCPDASRLEAVNLGVVLFSPGIGFIQPRLATHHDRLRKLFGKLDEPLLELQKTAIVARLSDSSAFKSEDDLRDFIDRRSGVVRLSPLRSIVVSNPAADLDSLFARLVGERRTVRHGPRARQLFAQRLSDAGIPRAFRRPETISLEEIGRDIHVEYAYKNGRYNLIEPVDFTSSGAWFATASARAIEGRAVSRLSHRQYGPMQMVVVANFSERTYEHVDAVRSIFADHQVSLHEMDRLDPLLEDIKAHLRPGSKD